MSKRIHDYIEKEELRRLQDHFFVCNDIDCPVCELFGEAINKLSKAYDKLQKGYLIVKIV